ncbi:cell division protein ZipA C-terminal FtsZ-binding domain-containing protein [Crenobacter luteus]|uniref:Cell division protein ZipA n=1 Tax=Crenobacter luteus TaxID=1452487 RepID=A0A165FDN4_9NEIS|nr:cell division protein ZipA C-terminal FtsZ-binding domain-containing protein [Crenobacter luteus]KZE32919.1 cell division protein FtsZ [Crenobacter luteus]
MSELQIGLLLLGAAVIALVYGFNLYQEWRFRKKTRASFARAHPDVLLEVPKNNVRDGVRADRLEPVLAGASPELDDEPDRAAPLPRVDAEPAPPPREPVTLELPPDEDEVPPDDFSDADRQALVASLLDPSLDFIAEVVFAEPHELAALPRFNVAKRVQLIGRTERGLWKPAEAVPGTRYKQLNIALQQVDRGGAVTEQELDSFCQQVARFADAHDAAVNLPHRQQKIVAARELDRFCADVDVLIGINVVPAAPLEGGRLARFAEAAGFTLEPDGAFHYLSDSGNTLYSLVSADQTPLTPASLAGGRFAALTLLFDVPRVAGGVEVFDRAVEVARRMAVEFDARLVDDNRRELSDAGLARIREQLVHIYGSMDDRGIAPGSVAALRLFA